MSSTRLINLRLLLLAYLLTGTFHASGQWNFLGNPVSSVLVQTVADTSDYLPYSIEHALELNLMIAASRGNVSEIERLIAKGADINVATLEGATPLVFAVSNNKTEAVKALLSHNPELEFVTTNDETPLMIAVKNRNFDISEMLIRAGADIVYADKYGATPLHYSAIFGYIEMVDLLLYYDSPVNLSSKDGTTPLLASVYSGQAAVADYLLQNGADPELSDDLGFTPFLLAAFYGDTLIMDILIKHGVNIYETNDEGHTALSISIIRDDMVTTDYLLRKGSAWISAAKRSVDPYTVALNYQRKDALSLLSRYNIQGKVKYKINQAEVTVSSRFNLGDYYTGFSMAFREPFLGTGIITGIDMKLWDTRVMLQEDANVIYQYHHRSYLAYAGVFKDFRISESPSGWSTYLSASLLAGSSFGNSLKGTLYAPPDKFVIIPALGFKMSKLNFAISGGAEYLKTPFYRNGPLWIRIGFSYNYSFGMAQIQSKKIKWY